MRRLGTQGTLALVAACAIAIGAAGSATAQVPGLPQLPGLPGLPADTPVQPFGTNDGGGFWNILPPGQNGHASGADIAAFLAACPPPKANCPNAPRPKHSSKELQMYGDLVYASPGLSSADVPKYFKDATFGVKQNEAERIYSPPGRDDVTIVRDGNFGVPHLYGSTRAGTMFGLGYVGAEDRLFVMDVLRNSGRAQLSAFAGGSAGNRAQDHTQWEIAPYAEADLQRQFDLGDDVYGAGGRELDSALLYQDTQQRFGRKRGKRVWADLRTAEDPEAPVTVNPGKRFPYRAEPRSLRRGGAALPDRGSVHKLDVVKGDAAASTSNRDDTGLGGMLSFPRQGSNALLVSGRESQSGKPIAVMGPQTAYFAPQLLMDVDVHGPGIDARGAAFAGISLYVLLGHGRDYAWSATSAGQDIIDTFALPLCEPDGSAPTVDSMHYVFKGKCTAVEVLEKSNNWTPSPAD